MRSLRHLPPAHSPIPAGALPRAVRLAADRQHDPIAELSALLRGRFAADRAVLYASGTQALTTAIRLELGRARSSGAGDDDRIVALPGYACYDIASAAVGANARIALYDIDPDTLGPDFDSLEEALRNGAAVVVVASLYGMPIDMTRVMRIAAHHGVAIIEDVAQAHGARIGDQLPGTFTHSAVLSFGRGKGWTGGAGGALLLRGPLADGDSPTAVGGGESGALLILLAAAQALLSNPLVYGVPASLPWLHLGETRYRPPSAPAGMTRAAAALALSTLEASDHEAAVRRSNAGDLARMLAPPAACRLPQAVTASRPGYLRFPLRLDPAAASRLLTIGARLGVAGAYPSTLADIEPVAARRIEGGAHLPGAKTLVRELVTLPTHSRTTPDDRAALARAIAQSVGDSAGSEALGRPLLSSTAAS